MKNSFSLFTLSLATLLGWGTMFPTQGAVIAGWDFDPLTGGSNNFGPSPFAATSSDPGVTVGGLTRGAGIGTTGGTGAGNAWGGNDMQAPDLTSAIAGNDFATFSVTVNAGNTLSLSSISPYNIRRSGTGPTTGRWQYQVNAGAFTDLTTDITWGAGTTASGNAQGSIDLTGVAALQNLAATTTVSFRVAAWGGTGSAGTFYLNDPSGTPGNDFVLNGTLGAPPPPPTPSSPGVIRINEILGSTTGTDPEFIELFNTTSAPIDISGWSLKLSDSDAGAQFGLSDGGSPFVIPSGTILNPGDFYLMANGTAATLFGVTPDLSIPENGIENSSYTALLLDGANNVIDAVFVTDGGAGDAANNGGASLVDYATVGPDGTLLPSGFFRYGDGNPNRLDLQLFDVEGVRVGGLPANSLPATPGYANLTNIPEPSRTMLALFGAALLLHRRRR